MIDSLTRLGIGVRHDVNDDVGGNIEVTGCAGTGSNRSADLWLENSGTSIRFLTALCTLGRGTVRLDGSTRMRERPIRDLVVALNQLGADVRCESESGCPPVVVEAAGLLGGAANVAGNISSQFLSALLMAAPAARTTIDINVEGELVSQPYVDMTLGVMSRFGVSVDDSESNRYRIEPQVYHAIEYDIEPDASAASYFLAAAAITGGEVTVEGLSRGALQGDVGFADALERMGCQVDWRNDHITVTGGQLHGIDIDMNAISDTAQTLAVVAVFAGGPTRIRNIAHVRHKETDRIQAVATELRRLGIDVDEAPDGLTIHPGTPQPATIQTYDDHRMAMSFALAGLTTPGIEIADPGCTSKTYPNYFKDLERLCEARR